MCVLEGPLYFCMFHIQHGGHGPMRLMLTLALLLNLFWVAPAMSEESTPLYLCDDGETALLTDRESRGCPPYRPAGGLTVHDGPTTPDIEPTVEEFTPYQPQPSRMSASEKAEQVCGKWYADLNLPSGKEGPQKATYQSGIWLPSWAWVQVSRWWLTANMCSLYIDAPVYPEF